MKKVFLCCFLQTMSLSFIFEFVYVLLSAWIPSAKQIHPIADDLFLLVLTAATFPLLQSRMLLRFSLPTAHRLQQFLLRLLSLGVFLAVLHLLLLCKHYPPFDLHNLYCRHFHPHTDPTPALCTSIFFRWESRYHLLYTFLELFLRPGRTPS